MIDRIESATGPECSDIIWQACWWADVSTLDVFMALAMALGSLFVGCSTIAMFLALLGAAMGRGL